MADSNGKIQDAVTVGELPGDGQGDGAFPGKTFNAIARPDREYAAGSGYNWYTSLPKSLSWAIDELGVELGSNLYERMLLDSQCRAAVNVLKSSILEDGITVSSAVKKKSDDGYKQAAQFADDANTMLADLTESFDDIMWDMLDAVALGYRMAEQVYELETTPSGLSRYTLTTLKVKPRESTAFVVDAHTNVLGILAKIPGIAWTVMQGSLYADLQNLPNFLPRSKFAILSFRPKNGDPRGTSVLRAAFDPWNQKQQLKREYLKYLTQFASPAMVGYTAPDADPYTPLNQDGTPMVDFATGLPVVNSPQQDMVQTMQTFMNGVAMAFANGSEVEFIQMQGDGAPFLNAFSYMDLQIIKAVLHQTLATEEGQHQTRASSGTHKDVLDTIVRGSKRPVTRMWRRDVLQAWVLLNAGKSALPLTPTVSLGDAEQEDRARLWTSFATLVSSGSLTDSQITKMAPKLGIPEPEDGEQRIVPTKETIMDSIQASGSGEAGKAGTPPEGNPALGKSSTPPPDTTSTAGER